MIECNGKKCYGKNKAKEVAHAIMRNRKRKLRVYECEECGYHHLTSVVGQK
jgi:uncharacterized Zn finger protein